MRKTFSHLDDSFVNLNISVHHLHLVVVTVLDVELCENAGQSNIGTNVVPLHCHREEIQQAVWGTTDWIRHVHRVCQLTLHILPVIGLRCDDVVHEARETGEATTGA